MKAVFRVIIFYLLVGSSVSAHAQDLPVISDSSKINLLASDTAVVEKKQRVYSPGKAAFRSAIIPGWGQIYNRKYWKVPIVYAALGTTAGIFVYNLQNYRDTRFAYRVKYNMRENGTDSALFVKIKDELKPLSESSLRSYRDQFRRDIDYSVLFFMIMWGLNVVDAAVDAHLKSFDVSPDLSFRFQPGRSQMAGTTGLSLVMKIGKNPDYQPRIWRSHF
jgi:hypothetical protein